MPVENADAQVSSFLRMRRSDRQTLFSKGLETMRSIMICAALAAAVAFTGCQGTGGSCPLDHSGCMFGKLGKRAAKATAAESLSVGCGCDEVVYSDQGAMDFGGADGGCGCASGDSVISMSAPTECGCGASDYGVTPVVSPIQFSAPVDGGCSACEGASVEAPSEKRGLFGKARIGNGDGMGMTMKERGLACNQGGPERRAQRQAARSLKPTLKDKLCFGATDEACEEFDLVSDEYVVGCDACSSGISDRRISRGFVSDVREVRGARGHFGGGCGRGGCGHSGPLCGACNKIRGLAGLGGGNPYGGAIPHTAQGPGQSGLAPSYAYPYYTTRGPRDFLIDNPPSIGR